MGQSFYCDECWFMTHRDVVALSKARIVQYDDIYSLAPSLGTPAKSDPVQQLCHIFCLFAGACSLVELDCIIIVQKPHLKHEDKIMPFLRNTFQHNIISLQPQ